MLPRYFPWPKVKQPGRENTSGGSCLVDGPSYLRVTERVQLASCFLETERTQTAPKVWGPSVLNEHSAFLDRAYSHSTQVLGTERVQLASCVLGTERTQTAPKFWGPSVLN